MYFLMKRNKLEMMRQPPVSFKIYAYCLYPFSLSVGSKIETIAIKSPPNAYYYASSGYYISKILF